MKTPFTGGCLCGEIRYTVNAEPVGMGHCHCRDCQYTSSTSHSSVALVLASSVSWNKGTPKEFRSNSDNGSEVVRSFCPNCGTPLTGYSVATKQFIGIKAATLDDINDFEPTIDSYISSAPKWAVFSDLTAKFEKGMS